MLESIQCPRRAVAFAHADDLNRKRNAADKTAGANQGSTAMLAEIFMLRLEAAARAAKEELAVCPDHIADCEGVLDPNLILRKTPRPVTHGQRAGTCHLPHGWSAGADDQLTNAALAASFGARRYTEDKRKPRGCSQGFYGRNV